MQRSIEEISYNKTCKQNFWSQAAILSGVSIIVLLISQWRTLYDIVEIWIRSETFRHGFIIFPIAFYLLWVSKEKNDSITPQTSILGVTILLGLVALWLIGVASNLAILRHLSFVAMIPAILWSYFGGKFIQNNLFPLAYLFFAVPMGEFLIPILQDTTATIAVYLLRLSNIPVVLEGRYFYIPGGSFEVAKACSGIRYLIATLAIGSLYAYFMYSNIWRRLLFLMLTISVPVIANGLRAYGIVILAHYSDYKYAVGFDHLIYGWMFFGVVIFLLFWVGSLFRENDHVVENEKGPSINNDNHLSTKKNYAYFSVVISILMLSPNTVIWLDRGGSDKVQKVFSIPVLVQKGWLETHSKNDIWRPHFKGATQEHRVVYYKNGQRVEVYLAYYKNQEQGREMINSANRFYDERQFSRKKEYTTDIELSDGASISVRTIEMNSKTNERIMYNWYLVSTTPALSALHVKLLEATYMFTGDENGSIAIAITADVTKTIEESALFLNKFVADFYPVLLKNITHENQI